MNSPTHNRIRVYIAGPLSSSGDRKQNVRLAMEAAQELIKAGYAPLTPHLSDYLDPTDAYGHDTWLAVDLPWVAVSQAVLRLSGPSKGADVECELAESLGIPVVNSIRELECVPFEVNCEPKPQPTGGDPRFLQILRDMAELHCRKSSDYGSDSDPFANIHGSTAAGVEPWRAAWVRALDKVQRINRYCTRGQLANESVEDSFLDLAAHSLIALIMHREEKPCPSSRPHNAPAKAPTNSARNAMAPA